MGFLGRFAAVMADQPRQSSRTRRSTSGAACAASGACAARALTSARLGLLSLPLLVMAVATGLWLYTVALRDDRPSRWQSGCTSCPAAWLWPS